MSKLISLGQKRTGHVPTKLSHVYWSFEIDGSTQTLTTEEFNYFMELKNQKDLERLQDFKSSKGQ